MPGGLRNRRREQAGEEAVCTQKQGGPSRSLLEDAFARHCVKCFPTGYLFIIIALELLFL